MYISPPKIRTSHQLDSTFHSILRCRLYMHNITTQISIHVHVSIWYVYVRMFLMNYMYHS